MILVCSGCPASAYVHGVPPCGTWYDLIHSIIQVPDQTKSGTVLANKSSFPYETAPRVSGDLKKRWGDWQPHAADKTLCTCLGEAYAHRDNLTERFWIDTKSVRKFEKPLDRVAWFFRMRPMHCPTQGTPGADDSIVTQDRFRAECVLRSCGNRYDSSCGMQPPRGTLNWFWVPEGILNWPRA